MKQIISEGKSYLWFPDDLAIIQRFQTAGLIVAPEENKTDVLNYFHIFISADTKEKIEDFVAYQENQGQLGFKSIQVRVRPIESPVDYGIEPTENIPLPSFEEVKDSFNHAGSFLTQMGGLNISIERVLIATPPPYEIIYTIDPEIHKKNIDAPVTIRFCTNQTLISCFVSQGEIEMKIQESALSQGWDIREIRKISSHDNPVKLSIGQKHTGCWQAEFKALAPETSIFTYEYQEQVLQ